MKKTPSPIRRSGQLTSTRPGPSTSMTSRNFSGMPRRLGISQPSCWTVPMVWVPLSSRLLMENSKSSLGAIFPSKLKSSTMTRNLTSLMKAAVPNTCIRTRSSPCSSVLAWGRSVPASMEMPTASFISTRQRMEMSLLPSLMATSSSP